MWRVGSLEGGWGPIGNYNWAEEEVGREGGRDVNSGEENQVHIPCQEK